MTERRVTWILPLSEELQRAVDAAPTNAAELDEYVRNVVEHKWSDDAVRAWAFHAYFDDYESKARVHHVPSNVLHEAGFFAASMRVKRKALIRP